MIESIAQGYAARFISSVAGRILTSDKTGDDAAGCSVASSGKAGPDTISISAKSRLLSTNDLPLPASHRRHRAGTVGDALAGSQNPPRRGGDRY